MTVLVSKEIRWNLVRIIVERLREGTNDFTFGDAFVPISSEEAAGLADLAVMASIADVLGCKYPGDKFDLNLGFQFSLRCKAEGVRESVRQPAAKEQRPLPMVLVIDSVAVWLRRYAIALEGRACVLAALSLEGGEGTFYTYCPDLSAVVVSACDGSRNNPEVPILVRRMRARFRGPIIATGGSVKYYQTLADAGCSHHMLKRSVPALLEKILDL